MKVPTLVRRMISAVLRRSLSDRELNEKINDHGTIPLTDASRSIREHSPVIKWDDRSASIIPRKRDDSSFGMMQALKDWRAR